jgi:hypothetical protein
VATAATSLTAGLVLLFAATIDRFESLKGLGVEAKTRQLDRKIEQADEALKRLREVAELTSETVIDLNNKIGRWDSAPTAGESYRLAQKTRSILTALGSDPATIRKILEPWAQTMSRDLTYALTQPLRQAMANEITRLQAERSSIPQPWNPQDPNLLRLNVAIDAAQSYVSNQLGKLWEWPLDAYPERLLAIFDDAPLPQSEAIRGARLRAEAFSAGMRTIRETFEIPNPEPWFVEIDAAMHPN